MSRLGSMVVRMVLDGLGAYKADLDKAAQVTTDGATKIEQATTRAGDGITRMGGAMGGAAGTAVDLAGAAGLAGAAAGALAAGIGLAAYAAFKGSKEQQAYNQALILTGNISGTTASQMQGMATGIDAVVGTHYQAAAALTAMASTGQVAGSNLQAFAQVAIQTERVVGTSVEDTAKVFERLGEEPVKASIKLNQSMNYLTASIFEQIKAAQDLGDSETAASIAQNAYATAHAARIEKIKEGLGTLEKAWIGVRDFAEKAWDKMLGLGREAGAEQQLAAQRKTVQMLEEQVAKGGLAAGNSQKLLDAARATLDVMGESARLDAKAANWQASQAQSQKAKIAWMQEGEKYQTKAEKLEGAIAAIRFKGAQAGADELEIEKRINVEREKAASKPGRADNSAARELEKEAALLATLSGVNADYLAQLDRLGRARDKGNISDERYVELVTELIAKQPMAKRLMDENTRAAALADKQMAESNVEYVKGLDTLDKSIEKIKSETEKELAKAAALGLTKIAAADLAAVELERDADAAERLANKQEALGLEGKTTKKYREQAQALRDLAAARRGTAARETEIDTEKEIANERKRGLEETDRLAREMFAGQEVNAKKVGEVFEKALKSAIYEATVKPLVVQIYTAVTGGGVSGAAGALGSAGSAANGVGLLGSVGSAFGAFGTGASYGATSVFANGFGATMAAGGQMVGAGSTAAGLGTMAGAIAPYAIAALVAKELMSYKIDAKGNALTATVGSTGVTNGQVGTRADFTQSSSGFLSGGNTNNSTWGVADQGVADYITASVTAITAANKSYGDSLGLTSAAIDGFTKNLDISITGLDAAGQRAAIDAELVKFAAEQSASAYAGAVSSFAKNGETTSITIARLATDLTGVNTAFDAMGFQLYDVSVSGAAMASKLVDAMGGLDSFNAKTTSYFQNYYTAEEQRAQTIKNINAATIGSTLDAATATRDSFKALVEAQDRTTDSGIKTYAALMSVADAFASITPAAVSAASAVQSQALQLGGNAAGGGWTVDNAGNIIGGANAAAVDSRVDPGWQRTLSNLWTGGFQATSMGTPDNAASAEADKALADAADAAAKALQGFQNTLGNLTDTNIDLRAKMLEAQGDTAGAYALRREKDLSKLTAGFSADQAAQLTGQYDANKALSDQIDAYVKSQAEATKATADAASAADRLKSAWAGITDSMLKEADRIRGVMAGSSNDSLAALQSQFAIATAQARAGDQTAAGNLSGYGGQLSDAIAGNAGSRTELIRMQAQVAQSLSDTAAVIGSSPAILTPFTPQAQTQSTAKLESAITSLQAEIAKLKESLFIIQTSTTRTAVATETLVEIAP